MTVQELIDQLTLLKDKGQTVWLEGCDCINRATKVGEGNGECLIEIYGGEEP